MQITNLCLIAICLASYVSFAFSQEPSNRILIHEVGKFPCDGFRAIIDVFLAELRENPGWNGVVINNGSGEQEILALSREEMIRSQIAYRGFDTSRIQFDRLVGEEFMTQFFRVRSSDPKPASFLARNYKLTSVSQPVKINDHDFDDLCPPIKYVQFFGAILEQNPKAAATILVRDRKIRDANIRKKAILDYLVGTRKIEPNRLKFFLTAKPDFEYGTDPYVEYRYVP